MHHLRFALAPAGLTLALGLLAGCAGPAAAPAAPAAAATTGPTGAPLGGRCNAQTAQGFVGQNATAKVVEAARVQAGAQMARTLRPGQMVTKEYSAERLNLQVDATGRILAVYCG